MKNILFVFFLLLLSCKSKDKELLSEFEFREPKQEQALRQDTVNTNPFLFAFRERSRLENGDWYRAKVFLVNYSIPSEYSDSTVVKFLPDSASYEEVLKKGVNAVVVGDTGYVKFKAHQQSIAKGDSVLKQWTAIYTNPAIPNRTYKVYMEYLLKGK
ncbi:hypothetical protein [Pontibacter chitinilyticus]|uniref:hypothetical protein n=1 Tax=Pontibacter chitinilyticus TaxID=2674989 RepID=UPI00321B5431